MTKLNKKDAVEMMANAQTIALKRYQSAVLMTPDLEGLAKETAALQEVLNTTDEVVRYIAQYMPDHETPSAGQDEVKKEPETWYSDNNGRVAIGTNDDGTPFVHYFARTAGADELDTGPSNSKSNLLLERGASFNNPVVCTKKNLASLDARLREINQDINYCRGLLQDGKVTGRTHEIMTRHLLAMQFELKKDWLLIRDRVIEPTVKASDFTNEVLGPSFEDWQRASGEVQT